MWFKKSSYIGVSVKEGQYYPCPMVWWNKQAIKPPEKEFLTDRGRAILAVPMYEVFLSQTVSPPSSQSNLCTTTGPYQLNASMVSTQLEKHRQALQTAGYRVLAMEPELLSLMRLVRYRYPMCQEYWLVDESPFHRLLARWHNHQLTYACEGLNGAGGSPVWELFPEVLDISSQSSTLFCTSTSFLSWPTSLKECAQFLGGKEADSREQLIAWGAALWKHVSIG